MPKKRKTRKQKEITQQRHIDQLTHSHIEAPVYSVKINPSEKNQATVAKKGAETTVEQKDAAYLRHDMVAISAATGIVLACDILLFVLLNGGMVKLNFLGY
jgi:uncharacterized ion transporter superfamily protein YfcC